MDSASWYTLLDAFVKAYDKLKASQNNIAAGVAAGNVAPTVINGRVVPNGTTNVQVYNTLAGQQVDSAITRYVVNGVDQR
jgi:hypothetical protein